MATCATLHSCFRILVTDHSRPWLRALFLPGQVLPCKKLSRQTQLVMAAGLPGGAHPDYHRLHRHSPNAHNPNGRNVGSRWMAPAVSHSCFTPPRCPKCTLDSVGAVQQCWRGTVSPPGGCAALEGLSLPQPACWHERGHPPEPAAPSSWQHPSQGHRQRRAWQRGPRQPPGQTAPPQRRGVEGTGMGAKAGGAGQGGRRWAEAVAAAEAGGRGPAEAQARRPRGAQRRGKRASGGLRGSGRPGRAAAGRERLAPPARSSESLPSPGPLRARRPLRPGGSHSRLRPPRPPSPSRASAGPAPSASPRPALPRTLPPSCLRPVWPEGTGMVPLGGCGQARRDGPKVTRGARPSAWGRRPRPRAMWGHLLLRHRPALRCKAALTAAHGHMPTRDALPGVVCQAWERGSAPLCSLQRHAPVLEHPAPC